MPNRKAKFKVYSTRAYNSRSEATVIIDRANNLISVKPFRQRREYQLRLEDVAAIICDRVILAERKEKMAAKKLKRRGGLFGR